MKFRTEAQRKAWQALDPRRRHLLMSHLPDDLERELALRHSIVTALENVYGPRTWGASLALIDDGEEPGDRWPRSDGPEMTYAEIGEEMKLSTARVRQIERSALRKLAHSCRYLHHFVNEDHLDAPRSTPEDIDAALARAQGKAA